MTVNIKGINKLMAKLDKLSNIESRKAVEEVANDIEKAIYNACPEDSTNSKKSVGVAEVREYENGNCYIDVGFSATKSDFNDWKGAWFNNWGWNSGGEFHSPNIGWFNKAIQSQEKQVKEKLKNKIKEELKAFKE